MMTFAMRQQISAAVSSILTVIEPDTNFRQGLDRTPLRVAEYWQEVTSGYVEDPEEILSEALFDEGQLADHKNMVIVDSIPFYSNCEHHMVPFFGYADVGYIPDGKVVGISKLPRLVDCFAKRLQVQERMTDQIVDALMNYLAPKGAMVVIRAEHLCMCSRGVKKPGARTITSAVRGVFLETPAAREEFLTLVGMFKNG